MAERMLPSADATPAPEAPGGRRVRMFLMVAGGLAAPCLALAAFFLTNSSGSATPTRPRAAATQAGAVTGATARPAAGAVTTTTTTVPAVPGVPARDPFVALVTQTPPGGAQGK